MTRKDMATLKQVNFYARSQQPNTSKNASRNNEAEGVESRARADRKWRSISEGITLQQALWCNKNHDNEVTVMRWGQLI